MLQHSKTQNKTEKTKKNSINLKGKEDMKINRITN